VARVRELAAGLPPSSPSVLLFRNGQPVYMLHRHQIEGRQAPEIAQLLAKAFDEYCVKQQA
jgi:putative YphP/YqiW family bacilliredoxin